MHCAQNNNIAQSVFMLDALPASWSICLLVSEVVDEVGVEVGVYHDSFAGLVVVVHQKTLPMYNGHRPGNRGRRLPLNFETRGRGLPLQLWHGTFFALDIISRDTIHNTNIERR